MRKETMIRIFEVTTETGTDNGNWGVYRVAAKTADEAIKKATKRFSEAIEERLLGVILLASEDKIN